MELSRVSRVLTQIVVEAHNMVKVMCNGTSGVFVLCHWGVGADCRMPFSGMKFYFALSGNR